MKGLSWIWLSVFVVAMLGVLIAPWPDAIGQDASQPTAQTQALPYTLTLMPDKQVRQGGILQVQLKASTGTDMNGLKAQFDGKTGIMFNMAPGTTETLFGIPVDTKPGPKTLRIVAPSGEVVAHGLVTVIDGKFPRQNISISTSKTRLQPLPGEMEAIQALKVNVTPVRHWEKPFISPTVDCENSPFGVKRYHNGVYINDYHKGVDLRSPLGRPIRAIADGVVKIAAPQFRLHGGTVGLDHGHGVNSIYIHMSKVAVKPGDTVKKGDVIGYVGATGFATGPHLHWGLYVNGVPVNPDLWIPVKRC